MLQLINTLYHGTAEKFETIDVFKGRNNKDFGKGFYMAVTKSQAIGMMHKKYREAILRRPNAPKDRFSETLYEIQIDIEYAQTLNIYRKVLKINFFLSVWYLFCWEINGIFKYKIGGGTRIL